MLFQVFIFFFFFQAEDGIRVYKVTGVQTCALPISNLGDRQLVQGRASNLPRYYQHGRPDRDGSNDQCGIHSVPYLPQRDGNPPDLSRRATAIAPLATRYFQSPAIRFLGVLDEDNSL